LNEIKTIKGIKSSKYIFPNKFDVYYNSALTNEIEILSLEIFKEYPATLVNDSKSKS